MKWLTKKIVCVVSPIPCMEVDTRFYKVNVSSVNWDDLKNPTTLLVRLLRNQSTLTSIVKSLLKSFIVGTVLVYGAQDMLIHIVR